MTVRWHLVSMSRCIEQQSAKNAMRWMEWNAYSATTKKERNGINGIYLYILLLCHHSLSDGMHQHTAEYNNKNKNMKTDATNAEIFISLFDMFVLLVDLWITGYENEWFHISKHIQNGHSINAQTLSSDTHALTSQIRSIHM